MGKINFQRKHTKARQLALWVLYSLEVGQENRDLFWETIAKKTLKEVKNYAITLIKGVFSYIKQIDEVIEKYSLHWKFDRIILLDKIILRIAVYELLYGSIPPRVVVNEAVELAKRYSSEEAYRFINGILDHIIKDYRLIDAKAV